MSQASDDTKAYSSWNRTPGKPNSSSNYHNTKMSNISSSTDSGVGRTPNWNSDVDCKFGMMEANPWSNNNVIQSNEVCQKLPWDENSLDRANNLTFGFSTQWGVGEDGEFTNQNPPWGLPATSPDSYPSNGTSTVDNCWNASSCQSAEDYLPRTASIWSSGTQRRSSDHESSNCTTTSTTVEHRALSLTQNVIGQDSDKRESSSLNVFKADPEEPQTWAQAAGKGILTNTSSDEDDGVKKEMDEQYETIINRVDGWGSHTVDQSTPWVVDELDDGVVLPLSACVGEKLTSLTESNVWTNEPPNGVGVWESHYENIGEKTSRWNNVNVAVKPKSGWEAPQAAVIGGQWDERDCDSCVWTASTNVAPEPHVKSAWMGVGVTQAPKQEQSNFVAPIGSGSRTSTQNFAIQRNSNALVPGMSGSISSDLSEPHSRQSFYQTQNMMTNNRSNPNLKVRPAINPGFRKEDAQGALFNSSMEIGRAMNQSSVNQSNMMAQRNDWSMPTDNFRLNNGEIDGGMMGTSGYIPQSGPPGGSIPAMKQHVMQQMHMGMGGRLPTENQLLFEKQIIKDINQLQAKQQELVQRINGLRSIAGSQAIIQEMTRTLNEVRQQLHTQTATLKVIRNQMPNMGLNSGSMNNQNPLSRPMPPGQALPQSVVGSDLSQHMSDLKLQKRAMDLWPQGNLPSPSNISPYMGMDKSPGMFYNPSGQMNGLMPQSFAYNSPQQPAFAPPHRQSGQMWPPRGMSGLVSGHVSNDCYPSMQAPHEDVDSMSKMGYPSMGPMEARKPSANTTTTALSLSQTLSSGSGVSSAFTSRDISFASANISEFVPGQPWPGVSFSQRDDSNVTLGTGQRSLLSVTNDHLEKLTISSDAGGRGANGTSVTYLFIRDLPSHINIEMLRNALTSHSFPGLLQMHPNLAARWVLLHFNSNEETMKAFKCLYGKVGVVELVPDQEVSQRIQYTNGTMGPSVPCAGPMDMHSQSKSHYLH